MVASNGVHLLHRDHALARLIWLPAGAILACAIFASLPQEFVRVLLGNGQIGISTACAFVQQLVHVMGSIAAAEPESDERRLAKMRALELLTEHMWIPTILTACYVVMVHCV